VDFIESHYQIYKIFGLEWKEKKLCKNFNEIIYIYFEIYLLYILYYKIKYS